MKNAVVLVLLISPVIASASGDDGLSRSYAACLDKAQAVDPAVLDCMSDEYERQDKRLNSAYRKVLAQLSGERKKELQDIQRLWLKYSEAHCEFLDDSDGGTAARQAAYECSIISRARRASELERLMSY